MDIDNVGLDRLHLVEGETNAGDRVFTYVMDENVALLDQLDHGGFALV